MDFREITSAGPCLMGIVNVTPDSFSDTGKHRDADAAIEHARRLVDDGARIIDVGAEASSFFRQGVVPTSEAEQIRRLDPVTAAFAGFPMDVWLSVDTRSGTVARAALQAGARIINDVSAGTHDPELLAKVARHNACVILMDMHPGYPATPRADDPDIIASVRNRLTTALTRANAAGIPTERIALDPGIGFGRTMADNWRLAWRAAETRPAGFTGPIVLGLSRKRFLEMPPPADVDLPQDWSELPARLRNAEDHPRDAATASLTALTARRSVMIHRVHNVALARRAMDE